jgi:hypothetical protein
MTQPREPGGELFVNPWPLDEKPRAVSRIKRGRSVKDQVRLGRRLSQAAVTGGCQRCHLARLLVVYTGWVTAKEQLQQLVAHLGEEQASRALRLLEPLNEELPEQRQAPALPEFVGIGDSGRSDVSGRVDELLAEGFGR